MTDLTRDDAERLLERSREARWTFPTSFGRPVEAQAEDWVEDFVADRESFADAARFLIDAGDTDAATEIAANVWRLWILARDVAGGRAFLAAVLDGADAQPSRARALALYGDGLLALRQGALEDSRVRNEAALEAARAASDPEALVLAHLGLSRVAFEDGDYERSAALAVQARELARPLGEAMGQAPLHLHAQSMRLSGADDDAAVLFTESLELNRRIGDQGMVPVELHNLGHVEVHRGNVELAERRFAECAEQGSPGDAYDEAMTYLNQAAVAFGRALNEQARGLLARAQSTLDGAGIDAAADDQFEIDWLRQQLTPGVSGTT